MPASPHCETPLNALRHLSLNGLREKWAEVFEAPAPRAARSDYLMRALAFYSQAREQGGLSQLSAKRLKQAIKDYVSSNEITLKPKLLANVLRAGARLLREWDGRTHEVLVLERGFEYLGQKHASLSVIARKITGTHWSGPRFFGLEATKTDKVVAKGRQGPTFTVDLNRGTTHGL